MFVTSSGTTTDFETYNFDVFTDNIVVASDVIGNESFNIAEVSAKPRLIKIKSRFSIAMFVTRPFIKRREGGSGDTKPVHEDTLEQREMLI